MFKRNDFELIYDNYWKIVKRGISKTNDKGEEIDNISILCHYTNFCKALERFLELTGDKESGVYLEQYKALVEEAKTIKVEVNKPSYNILECLKANEIPVNKIKAIMDILGDTANED